MLTKLCIVAGVGPGMGIAIARRFAKAGFAVAMLARRKDALDGFVAEIDALGVKASGWPCDLTDLAATRATLDAIIAAHGSPEVIVHNASLWRQTPSMALDPATFHADLALDITSALVCAQAVHPAMKEAGRGSILITGGGLALAPVYGAGVLSLATGKSGVRGFTIALAKELEADRIHVGTVTIAGPVAPGTPFDPDRIAAHFQRLHEEPEGSWTVEHVFKGEG